MKNHIKSITIGLVAVALVASPLVGFAKDNGKNDNNGRGEQKKEQKQEKEQKKNNEREDERDEDKNPNKNSVANSRSSQNNSENLCFKAYGHLIAPGWLKKNGNTIARKYIVQNCWLPFGINKKFRGQNASTTPDVTAPVISNLTFNPAKTQTEVRWKTDEYSNSIVYWSTNPSIDTSSTTANKITKNNFTKDHRIILKNLTASTTYYVVVQSRDYSGNISLSSSGSFTTKAPSTDNQLPVLSNIVTVVGTSTIQVGWKTNENTTDRVYYSTILPVVLNASTTSFVSNASSTKTHLLLITGLNPNTTYYLVIESTDTAGNVTTSATFSAHTNILPVAPDVTAPVITSLLATPGSSTTTVSWTTDELATSKVFYSTASPVDVGATTTPFILNGSLVTSHSIQVTGLSTSTLYYFKVQSADASVNTATSGEVSTTTMSGI